MNTYRQIVQHNSYTQNTVSQTWNATRQQKQLRTYSNNVNNLNTHYMYDWYRCPLFLRLMLSVALLSDGGDYKWQHGCAWPSPVFDTGCAGHALPSQVFDSRLIGRAYDLLYWFMHKHNHFKNTELHFSSHEARRCSDISLFSATRGIYAARLAPARAWITIRITYRLAYITIY